MHSVSQLYQLALHDNVDAMYALGKIYLKGSGNIPKDDVEAFRWFSLAAGKGYTKAYKHVAYCNYAGIGTDKNITEAQRWYQKAAEAGDTDSQANVKIVAAENAGWSMPSRSLSIIASICLSLFWISACTHNKTLPPTSNSNPLHRIEDSRTATTQIVEGLGEAATTTEKNSEALNKTSVFIQDNVIQGRIKTPPAVAPTLDPIWGNIMTGSQSIQDIRMKNGEVTQQLKDYKDRAVELTGQLDSAIKLNAEREAFYKKELETRDNTIKSKNKSIVDLQSKDKERFRGISILAILCVGASVLVGMTLNPKWGKAGAIASGVVLGLAIIVGETLPLVKWFAGAAMLGGFIYVAYMVFVYKKGFKEVVQSFEVLKDTLPVSRRVELLGMGAQRPRIWDDQSESTRSLVKAFREKIRKASPLPRIDRRDSDGQPLVLTE